MRKKTGRFPLFLLALFFSISIFATNFTPTSGFSFRLRIADASLVSTGSVVDAIAVWQHGEAGAQDIWYSIWDDSNNVWWAPSGSQASPIASLTGSDVDPAVSFDRQGNAIAVWSHRTGSTDLGFDIWYSKWAGNAWTPPAQVASLPGNDTDPSVAVDSDGWAIAIWVHNSTEIYYSLWDGTNWIGPAQAIVSDWPLIPFWGSALPEIAFTSSRGRGYTSHKAVAVWTLWIIYPEVPPLLISRLYYAIWDGASWSPSPAEEIPGQMYNAAKDGTPSTFRNSISSDSLNNAIAVWATDNIQKPIYYALWNGHIWGEATALDAQKAKGYKPAVAFNAYNDALLVFTHSTTNIWHSRYIAGEWQTATEAADSGGDDSRPSTAFLESNRAVATWSSNVGAFAPSEIFYSIWNSRIGGWTAAASIVLEGLSGSDSNPSIASSSGSPTMPPTGVPPEIHDVAVTDVNPSKTVVAQGYTMTIKATIQNQGDFTETFDVTVYADLDTVIIGDEITVASQSVTLAYGASTTITVTWNTATAIKGSYTTSAKATLPSPLIDSDPSDNTRIDGQVFVTIPGDLNGDRNVNSYDLYDLGKAYGSNLSSLNWNPEADINNDGSIDVSDVEITSAHWGQHW